MWMFIVERNFYAVKNGVIINIVPKDALKIEKL